MRGMEFLEKLDRIDPAYLAEAEQFSAKKRRRLSGHMIVDGIYYMISISHLPEDADRAMELLCRWADQL